jgi:hypothetical protein
MFTASLFTFFAAFLRALRLRRLLTLSRWLLWLLGLVRGGDSRVLRGDLRNCRLPQLSVALSWQGFVRCTRTGLRV